MGDDSPDLVIAMRLLDHAKLRGFQFQRDAPGEDGPLLGNRVSGGWVDTIYIEGFSHGCFAWRKRTSLLIVPGDELVERRVDGDALTVLNEVLTWETGRDNTTHASVPGQPDRAVSHEVFGASHAVDRASPTVQSGPKGG